MGVSKKLKSVFIAGILALLPFVITVYFLYFLYNVIISNATPIVKQIARQYHYDFNEYIFQIITFVIIILLVFLIGVLTRLYFGKMIIKLLDSFIAKIPVARSIYNATKQVVESFKNSTGTSFSKVVLVEFPRRDMWMVAFLVRDSLGFMVDASTKEESCNVFIPTAPNPTSGFIAVVPKKDVRELDITVEEGVKFVLSVGIINLNSPSNIEKIRK